MENKEKAITTIDAYIETFPEKIRAVLRQFRQAVREAAPEAEEKISYQMPTFFLNGNLVHFAAHKNHIGFYPTPGAIEAFEGELSAYKRSKGAVQFPTDRPLPVGLIKRITAFRVRENTEKADNKRGAKRGKK